MRRSKNYDNMFVEVLQILFSGVCVGLASSMTVGPVAVLCIQRTLSKGHLSGFMSGLGVACADTLLAILAFTVYALLKRYIDEYSTIIQICGGIFVVVVGIFIFFKNPVPQIRKNRAGKKTMWQDFVSMFGFTLANFVVIIPYILAFFTMFNVELQSPTPVSAPPTESVAVVAEAEEQVDDMEKLLSFDEAKDDFLRAADAFSPAKKEESRPTIASAATSNVNSMIRNSMILLGFLLGAIIWWAALTSLINLFRRGFRPRHMLTINHVAGVVIGALGLYTLLSVLI